jgi:hypothetical protein
MPEGSRNQDQIMWTYYAVRGTIAAVRREHRVAFSAMLSPTSA